MKKARNNPRFSFFSADGRSNLWSHLPNICLIGIFQILALFLLRFKGFATVALLFKVLLHFCYFLHLFLSIS